MEHSLRILLESITPAIAGLTNEAQEHLNNLTKPEGSLGRLEELAILLWKIQGKKPLEVDPAAIYTVAADHGVAEEKISLYPQEVTRQMVINFINGGAAINILANLAGAKHYVVDVGCKGEAFSPSPSLISHRIKNGTDNFTKGPAMSREECWEGINLGVSLARNAAAQGVRCIGTGEMGIGNTTSAAALFAAYFDFLPEEICGRGAGLALGGFFHKCEVVRGALEINQKVVASGDPFNILAALGGLEIATLAGLILGGASQKMVLLIDGFIATAAYAAAWKMCPAVRDYCVFSHKSRENGHATVLSYLSIDPLLNLDMCLGEGTGVAVALPILRAAAEIFNKMATFSSAGISGKE